ncbi:hypothetical protein L2E82_51791 [Cichorium intybus]|nr:hypothetical protein L2E82_51791 [Cichorium intybus]
MATVMQKIEHIEDEIEVVENTDHAAAGNGNGPVGGEGCSIKKPDDLGYSALQWAALNNRVAVAQYIFELNLSYKSAILRGADVNAVDLTGQTTLHWSAVKGAIQVADLLLEEGAHVYAADVYRYQTTHVAAQYGQTAYLYHIVTKWNADIDIPDNEGRSPLHWYLNLFII